MPLLIVAGYHQVHARNVRHRCNEQIQALLPIQSAQTEYCRGVSVGKQRSISIIRQIQRGRDVYAVWNNNDAICLEPQSREIFGFDRGSDMNRCGTLQVSTFEGGDPKQFQHPALVMNEVRYEHTPRCQYIGYSGAAGGPGTRESRPEEDGM